MSEVKRSEQLVKMIEKTIFEAQHNLQTLNYIFLELKDALEEESPVRVKIDGTIK